MIGGKLNDIKQKLVRHMKSKARRILLMEPNMERLEDQVEHKTVHGLIGLNGHFL